MRVHVVIAAYGPTRRTRAAVRRARALTDGGSVHVLPGLGVGAGAARRAAAPGVEIHDACGSAGLAGVLDALGTDEVLLVHDDVLVTAGILRRMAAHRVRRGGVVVPFSNDVGMDHFCGPLPPVDRAAARLEAVARSLSDPPEATVVRPSCLLGPADELRGLLDHHVVDPRVRLELVDAAISIAPGAVVAHDNTCAGRLAQPQDPGGRPLLKAVMIVRDEQDMVAGAIESLRGLVDEVVVCDTGSTDATAAVAGGLGARVVHARWEDDFAAARNAALDAAGECAWLLSIDADERVRVSDPVLLRRMLATYVGEYDAFVVEVTNRISEGRTTSFRSSRLFAGGKFRWGGRIHEYLIDVASGGPARGPHLELLTVDHLGYSREVVTSRDKAARNLELARAAYEAEPGPKTMLEYARSIRFAGGDRERSYALMAEVVADMEGREPDPELGRSLAYVLGAMAEDALELGRPQEAVDHARRALELVPADDVAARACARALVALGRPEEALEHVRGAWAKSSLRPLFENPSARVAAESHLCAAAAAVGRFGLALELGGSALARAPEAFEAWPEVIASLDADGSEAALETMLGLFLADPSGGFTVPLARTLPPPAVAWMCLACVRAGGGGAEVVSTGLAAALVAGLDDVFSALAAHVGALDDARRMAIAQRAAARSRYDLAALLTAPAAGVAR